jgi:diguanylate cyclase (GGDEF)-like protein
MNNQQDPQAQGLAVSQLMSQLQGRRLRQIATVLSVTLAIVAIQAALLATWIPAVLGVLALVCVRRSAQLSQRGELDRANFVLLSTLTATASAAMWDAQGLYNGTLLTFPVILILAGMLARPRLFVGLLLAMLAVIGLITATSLLGWRTFSPEPLALKRFITLSCILMVCAFAIWRLASDLRDAMRHLQEEVERVKRSETSLSHLAQHDVLTGLPNRLLVRDRLEQAVVQARRYRKQVALLYIDLDNFKLINDSLGHAAGDELLQAVAERLQDSVREVDTVSRQGGDEFLLVLSDVADQQAITQVAQHVLANLAPPFVLQGMPVVSSCSIGIATFPENGDSFAQLLQQADMAMYQAKMAGRNTFRFFDQGMNVSLVDQLQLEAGMRQALQRDEFVLYYQPIVDIHSGRLLAAEALVRWQHPERGLITPEQFIPLAERSGLIVEIGEWVLNQACQQLVAWQTAGLTDLVVSVNLSPVQFRRGDLDQQVHAALTRSGLAPAGLELELTESILLQDSEKFISLLMRVKALGVSLAIDDFGTGYSNLSYLQRFQVDKLKIDQSFVGKLHGNSQGQAIVTAIIQMAKSLQLVTTAEGIEDEATRQLLASLGCDQAQGYWFARPLPAADFALYAQHAAGAIQTA